MALPPALVIPAVPGLPVVAPFVVVAPPLATNAVFVTAYQTIPIATRHGFEQQVWAQLQATDPLANQVQDYGSHYLRTLTRTSFGALPPALQDAISLETWTATGGAPLFAAAGGLLPGAAVVMSIFVNNMLP